MEIDRPTGADYAMREAEEARKNAERSAKADAASREELERQVTVLRGQVAFLSEVILKIIKSDTNLSYYYRGGETEEMLEKIKENNW